MDKTPPVENFLLDQNPAAPTSPVAGESPPLRARARARIWPIADSYLLWAVLGSSLRGLGWFAGLFLAFAIVTGAQRVAQKGLPFMAAVEGIALQMPRIILFTIPASLLFGAVSTFTEMSAKGEITALGAGGMSLRRMLRAPFFLSVCLALLAFWMQETVVPDAELRKGALLERALNRANRVAGFVYTDSRPDKTIGRVIQAELFDPVTRTLTNPTVQIFGVGNTVELEIKAQRAYYDEKRGLMIFKNGFWRANPARDNRLGASVTNAFDDFSIQTRFNQLSKGERSARDQIKSRNYEMVSWQQLNVYRAEQAQLAAQSQGEIRLQARAQVNAATFGIHDKFALPLVIVGMLLIGAPLGIRPQRTASPGIAMGLSLMVMLGYYFVWTICTHVGKSGVALSVLFAYFPSVVLWITGLILLQKRS